MFACTELEDGHSLEMCRVRPGMTFDLFPCHLCSAQVYVQKDWERLGTGRRFVPQAWTRQNGATASHLREWIAAACNIHASDVTVERRDGTAIEDDFSDWASLLEGPPEGGVTVTAFRYADAPCGDVSVLVGNEVFFGVREVLLRTPFFALELASQDGVQSCVEVKDVDLKTFHSVWHAICEVDLEEGSYFLLGGLSAEDLWRVLDAAHRFGMKALHKEVSRRLQEVFSSNIAPTNAASWIARARRCKAPQLCKAGLDFASENGREVLLAMAGEDWSADLAIYESIVLAALRQSHTMRRVTNGGA